MRERPLRRCRGLVPGRRLRDGDRARRVGRRCRAAVERNTDAVLALFDEAGVKATFFTLGWVAERHPALIRRIAEAGHEIASHGWDHQRVFTMSEAELPRRPRPRPRRDRGCVRAERRPAIARRASRSTRARPGRIRCSPSRAMPIPPASRRSRHDHYGWREAPRFAWRPVAGADADRAAGHHRRARRPPLRRRRRGLLPAAALSLLELGDRPGQRAPRSGPAIFYFHPWEIDPGPAARRRTRRSNRGCAITPISPRCGPSC